MEPGLGAVIFLTICIVAIFSFGFFLVHRVMTKPGAHIGSRLPKDDHAEGPESSENTDGPDEESGRPGSPEDPDDPGSITDRSQS